MLLEAATLVREVATRMKERNPDPSSSSAWTQALKASVRDFLQTEGISPTHVLYSHTDSDTHEFLLDIVVWNRDSGEGIQLAVESEWLQRVSEIEKDFWKLLVVKAPLKLMVFATTVGARIHTQEEIWNRIVECMKLYRDHTAGEQYVFMDYAPGTARKAWSITIPANGQLASVPEMQIIPFG